MGFLDNIISQHKDNTVKDWIHLTEVSQVDDLIKESHQHPVVIFKHSTTCGISAGAQHRIKSGWEDLSSADFAFYYLDLLSHRDVSNYIAERLEIVHQSPQIIVVKDGIAVYDTSHHSVNAAIIAEQIA